MTDNSDVLARVCAGEQTLIMDGGMGSLIQAAGLAREHAVPDVLNITHAADILAIQRAYVDAGAQCITTNTFNASPLKLKGTGYTCASIYQAAADIARAAGALLIAGDIGPTGEMLEPYGDLEEDEAYELFAEQAQAAKQAGCNLILVETMADPAEAATAVRAAVQEAGLPVFATMTFEAHGKTLFGTSAADAATTLLDAGATAVGANCGLGPEALLPIVQEMAPVVRERGAALIAQPNAGMPELVGTQTVYNVGPSQFAEAAGALYEAGATIVGGCCGTTPEHIAALAALPQLKATKKGSA